MSRFYTCIRGDLGLGLAFIHIIVNLIPFRTLVLAKWPGIHVSVTSFHLVKDNDLHVKIFFLIMNINYRSRHLYWIWCLLVQRFLVGSSVKYSRLQRCKQLLWSRKLHRCQQLLLLSVVWRKGLQSKGSKKSSCPCLWKITLQGQYIWKRSPWYNYFTNACQWFWFGKKWSHILFHDWR